MATSGRSAGARPFFAGTAAYERMDLARQAINEIRRAWADYPVFMAELRDLMRAADVDVTDDRVAALLSSVKEWWTEGSVVTDGFEAVRLYSSVDGYEQIFRVINTALRSDDLVDDRQRLRATTFLVELIDIDLFNYRATQPYADNFEGTVYRGMSVSSADLALFRRIAAAPLEQRYLSVPSAMVSAMRVGLMRAARTVST